MHQTETLVLASQSAARAKLLRDSGIAFTIQPGQVDESAVKQATKEQGGSAEDAALTLATLKASQANAPGSIVLGADQILVCTETGRWFDKPIDIAEARTHLQALRGKQHVLVTAAICLQDGTLLWSHVAQPTLTMRTFSDTFLDAYLELEAEKILQTVGAYRIEGPGIHLFERIDGDHAAILGLPLLPLLGFLRDHGVLTG